MKRWTKMLVCVLGGWGLLFCGWLVPRHLEALDEAVLSRAGRGGTSVVEWGLALTDRGQTGAAQLMLEAAEREGLPGRQILKQALARPTRGAGDIEAAADTRPFTDFALALENRDRLMGQLSASSQPAVLELLRFREATHTEVFPPSRSASGQALDAAISVTGWLMEKERLSPKLAGSIGALATTANRGGGTRPLEEALLDLMSLGQRLTRAQLEAFVRPIDDLATLRILAGAGREKDGALGILFAAGELSGQPASVASYLARFGETGEGDIARSLEHGSGAVKALVSSDKPLYRSALEARMAGAPVIGPWCGAMRALSWSLPGEALALKWVLFFGAGYVLALALHFARGPIPEAERPLEVRGFHVAREMLFAVGFLLVVLLLSEPFLALSSPKADFHLGLRLPIPGEAAPGGTHAIQTSLMETKDLLTLILFFVLQAMLYLASLLKLGEIRRQRIQARMKLRLLENEDHLFDAGLYLGFVGTIVSLILASMKMVHFSLMAAYSSTSFGIIFVCIFKIFHLRPCRRSLLLEAEDARASEPETAATAHAPYTAS
jgi:hypothetical protein